MSTMDVWPMSGPDLEIMYSRVLDLVVTALIDDGLLAKDSGVMWAASHAVIVRETSRLSRWANKFFGWPKNDDYRAILVTLTGKSNTQYKKSPPSPLEGGDETTEIQ